MPNVRWVVAPDRPRRWSFGALVSLSLGWALVLAAAGPVRAAEDSTSTDLVLDRSLRRAIVERIATTFDSCYIDAGVARELGGKLKAKAAAGGYRRFDRLGAYTKQLTEDLRDWSDDLHITIMPYEKLPDFRREDRLVGDPADNYGFRRAEVLPGNIGYLELTGFYSVSEAGPTAVAAMNYLANCRALIIDLRLNGGGDVSMATLLSSYLFGKSTHLDSDYYRVDDRTVQNWTCDWVPGPRLADVPVYILLSRLSFSCSEAFSFNLQQLGRAVVVGEQTRGGGHSVTYLSYPKEHINVRVPYSRTTNAVSGTGFQSVGVTPDIPARHQDALAVANVEIAKKILANPKDDAERFRYEWIRREYSSVIAPVEISDRDFQQYVGNYGTETVTLECGGLVERAPGGTPRHLVFLGDDLFTWRSDRGYSRYRTQFVRDDVGAVSGLHVVDDDGDSYEPAWRKSD